MDKDLYFKLMKETSDVTDEIILGKIAGELASLSRINRSIDIHDLVSDLPRKRAKSGKAKSRPAIFRFAYESVGGKDWKEYQNIAAAIEMLNLSTYVLNYVLDDKGGEKPKQQRNNECMVSMILRELAQKLLIEDGKKLSLEDYLKIDENFSEINKSTSGIGQILDGNELRKVDPLYLHDYIDRCDGLTGRFMQNICEMGGVIGGASGWQMENLSEFGGNYGTLVQIINDLGDFLPHDSNKQGIGKVYQDQFSDLRHGCITYPAYIALTGGGEEAVKKVQGNLDATPEDCLEVTKAFIKADGIKKVKSLAGEYAKKAKGQLSRLPKTVARDFLNTALSIYRTNKFYDAFKKLK